ncbi:MAG: galactosyltransferase-related protein, partial [Sphaerospermopsis kisseleviana]
LVSGINVEKIVENNPTPLALHKSTYWDIGGHDQDFWGWGGEDTEFLDRLRTCKISEGGWLPFIHLWHPSAPKKANGDRNNQILIQKMTCSSQVRINTLKQKNEML